MSIQSIQQFLSKNKNQLDTPTTKWPAINWQNQKKDVHIAYVKLCDSICTDPTLPVNKQLSMIYCQYKLDYFSKLNAPEIITQPFSSNIVKLKSGKGKQMYISQLYNESLKHI